MGSLRRVGISLDNSATHCTPASTERTLHSPSAPIRDVIASTNSNLSSSTGISLQVTARTLHGLVQMQLGTVLYSECTANGAALTLPCLCCIANRRDTIAGEYRQRIRQTFLWS